MSQPIYKVYMAHLTEAGYQLTREEQGAFLAKHKELANKLGIKTILTCDSSWMSEEHLFWGVEEYPNMEALHAFHAALNEMNWFRYVKASTLLGTPMSLG